MIKVSHEKEVVKMSEVRHSRVSLDFLYQQLIIDYVCKDKEYF